MTTTLRDVHVNIGKVKVGTGPVLLKAILGSCVGIGFLWRKRGIYGLAHCLLGDAPEGTTGIGARYVTQAIPSLLELMEVGVEHRRRIEVVVAGGGHMADLESRPSADLVGTLNVAAADRCLKEHRLYVAHREIGGDHGRTIQIDCLTGKFTVGEIPRLQ